MSIRKGTAIIAGNIGQTVDDSLSLTSSNPVKNKIITRRILDIESSTLNEKNATNCITSMENNVLLNFYNTTLTALMGTKAYAPNGFEQDGVTPHFDEITLLSDLVLNVGGSEWVDEPHMITISNDGTSSFGYAFADVYSGDSAPSSMSSQYGLWYDTANNIIRRTEDTGTTWTNSPYSFPICTAINTNGACKSVEQIFNGFGYIGSVVFLLPGVTALFPDGKNDDDTLRNLEVTSESVIIKNFTNLFSNPTLFDYVLRLINHSGTWKLDLIEPAIEGNYTYNSEENYWYYYTTKSYYCPFARVLHDKPANNSKILSFSGKQTIKIIDSGDTSFIAHQSSPSNKYIELSIGATGTQYTAPADGYFTYRDSAANVGAAILENTTTLLSNGMNAVSSTWPRRVTIRVKKGDKVKLYYENGGTNQLFRFVYANGAI